MSRRSELLRNFLGRGVFPSQLAWFLEGPWRRWVLSPETLHQRLPLAASNTVCELGIGGGYYGRALAPFVERYAGVDIQLEMLERVRMLGAPASLHLIQADGGLLPFAPGSVDLVLAVTVLGEVPSPVAAIAESARILRPGGILSVSEHIPDPDFIPVKRLVEMCKASGLALENCYGHSWSYTANFRKAT